MENEKDTFWDVISNTEVSNTELVEAIKGIGKLSSQIKFWNEIANNTRYTLAHRKHCVLQLFKRHANAGMPLGEFVRLFLNEKWFEESQFEKIDAIRGKLPIEVAIDRSIFQISVLPDHDNNDCFIYFSVEGKISKAEVINIQHNDQYFSALNQRKVLEIGYASDLLQDYNKPY